MNLSLGFSLLDAWGFSAARYLLSVLWQSSLLLLVVLMLSRLLRHRRARAKHLLWVAALAVAPFLPLLTSGFERIGAPQAPVAVLPAYTPVVTVSAPMPAYPSPALMPPAPVETVAPVVDAPPVRAADCPWALGFLGYLLGVAVFLTWFAMGRMRIRRWVHSAWPCTGARVPCAFREANTRLALRRAPPVLESPGVPVPVSTGILHPRILLPVGLCEALSDDELFAVALHETAHVARRDPLVLTLVALVRALLFFHPLVWLAARRISILAEHCADDAVLDATGAPLPYAKMLARLSEELPRRSLSTEMATGLLFTKSAFLARVEAVLGDRSRIRRLSRFALAATVCGMCASLAIPLALPLASEGMPNPEMLLQSMRENDTRFENLVLDYARTTEDEIGADFFWAGQRFGEEERMPDDYYIPRHISNVYHCTLLVRGDNIVQTSRHDKERSQKDKYVGFGAYHRGADLEGTVYDLSDMMLPEGDPGKSSPNYEKQLRITPRMGSLNQLYDVRMGTEFAFGIGFGKRIKEIDSITPTESGLRIEGSIQIWTEDVSRFVAELDSRYLVRAATVEGTVGVMRWQLTSTSEGNVERSELRMARSGTYCRLLQNTGKAVPTWRVEFERIETNLSDARFSELTAFPIEPMMQVNDDVHKIEGTGVRQPDGSVKVGTYQEARAASQSVTPATRVLRFPKDRVLGLLLDLDKRNPKTTSDWWWMNLAGTYERFALAEGDVEVPAGTRLGLEINPAEWSDLSPLAALPPGVIEAVGLHAKGYTYDGLGLRGWRAKSAPDDETLARICTLAGLRELHLDGGEFTNEGLAALENLRALERLSLIMSGLNREGLDHVGRLSSLTGLRIWTDQATSVDDLAPLTQLYALEELSLGWKGLVERWVEAFAHLPQLRHLRISGGNRGPEGLESLADMHALRELEVYDFTGEGLASLPAMPDLVSLDIQRTGERYAPEHMEGIARQAGLRSLRITAHLDSNECVARLTPLRQLRHFHHGLPFSGGMGPPVLSDETLSALAEMPTLESISLYEGRYTTEGLAELVRLPNLSALEIPNSRGTTDAILAPISRMKSLRSLYLRGDDLTEEGLAELKRALPECEIRLL